MRKLYRFGTGWGVVLLGCVVMAHAAKPESKWRKVGKTAHTKVAHKSLKSRNQYCANACRKAGAHKASDAGACKETCVFG